MSIAGHTVTYNIPKGSICKKCILAYNTKVKEMKRARGVFPNCNFEFATMVILQERTETDIQCSGMFIVVIKIFN